MRTWLTLFVVMAASVTAAAKPAGPKIESATHETRVCTGGEIPPAGTPVSVMRRVCQPLDAKRIIMRCMTQEIARGEIVRADGKGCAIVRVPNGSEVQPGDSCAPSVYAQR